MQNSDGDDMVFQLDDSSGTRNDFLRFDNSAGSANFSVPLGMGSNQINNVADPTEAQDAATKSYVDSQVSSSSCPSGYVRVPGSDKYGTSDFCVMKWEAKNDGSGNPVSQASGNPWVNIEQYTARQECRSLGDNYHLISEREWMTIAENVMRQPSNWADSNIGSKASNGGGMYIGNVAPPSSHSHLGYDGPNPDSGTSRPESASLNLSNGNEIYDLSGNVWEWTDYYIISDGAGGNEMPQPGDSSWHEYTNITDYRGMRHARPLNPSWNASQGIGRMHPDGDNAYPSGTTHAVLRGGHWGRGADAGVLSVALHTAPSRTYSGFGFRCSKTL
ncbi:MAG: SUMF1/EgtB/PvdO family nonheme iron enzyme [Candidatus Nanohalobium sp.]